MHVFNQRSGDFWVTAATPGAEGEAWTVVCFGVVHEIGQHLIVGHLYQGDVMTHTHDDQEVMELTALFIHVDDVEDEGDDAEGDEEEEELDDDEEGEYDDEMSDASTSAGSTDFSVDDTDLDVMDDL